MGSRPMHVCVTYQLRKKNKVPCHNCFHKLLRRNYGQNDISKVVGTREMVPSFGEANQAKGFSNEADLLFSSHCKDTQ